MRGSSSPTCGLAAEPLSWTPSSFSPVPFTSAATTTCRRHAMSATRNCSGHKDAVTQIMAQVALNIDYENSMVTMTTPAAEMPLFESTQTN